MTPELTLRRRLPHPIERVWRAIADPEELAQWFVFEQGEITESDPPRRIAWEKVGQMVRFELEPDGDGTWLTFTHRFEPRYGSAEQHSVGWENYFRQLDAFLAGGSLGEQEAHDQRKIALLEDGPELRSERRLFHPVERVWRALTEAAELAQWFPGNYEVVEADPPRLLVARWHGETLRFDLEAEGDFAVLRFSHTFEGREFAARSAAGWDRCFERLEALLRGGPVGERESLALWPHVHERYAEEFGVDPEIGRRAYAEHPAT
jgi:uncharacterized protein YndB with AHSA1/START domain